MPKTRKTKVAVEDTTPEDTSETQQWVATREYDLIENPYAELTREAASLDFSQKSTNLV